MGWIPSFQRIRETKFPKCSAVVSRTRWNPGFWLSEETEFLKSFQGHLGMSLHNTSLLRLSPRGLRSHGIFSVIWNLLPSFLSPPPPSKIPNGRWTWTSEWQSLGSERKGNLGMGAAWLDILGFSRWSLVVEGPLTLNGSRFWGFWVWVDVAKPFANGGQPNYLNGDFRT